MEDALVGRLETSEQAGVAWSFPALRFYSTEIFHRKKEECHGKKHEELKKTLKDKP